MWDYLKRHEAFIGRALLAGLDPDDAAALGELHARQLAYLQHERLIHLLVTLAIALFWLLTIGFVTTHESLAGLAVFGCLLLLLVAYLVHYFRLENGVQRLYLLANRIEAARSQLGRRYLAGDEKLQS